MVDLAPPPIPPQKPPAPSRIAIAIAAPLLAMVLYVPSLWFSFVWDDTYFVVRNESIRSLENIPRFFYDPTTNSSFEDLRGLYRPLRNVSYALDHSLWGLRPGGYHFTNVLFHVLNTVLVYLLLVRLVSRTSPRDENALYLSLGPLIGALFWAVHPLATEAVCWVKARDDLMVATFCVLGGWVVARQDWTAPRIRIRFWILLGAMQLGALLSKETGVVFPALMLLIAWTSQLHSRTIRDMTSPPLRNRLLVWVFLGAVLDVMYIVGRMLILGEVAQLTEPLVQGPSLFWTQIRAIAHGIRLIVWPSPLLADYQAFRISSAIGATEIAALLLVIGMFIAAAVALRRFPLLSLAILWWFLAILPVSNLVPTMQFLAERFFYLALIGPCLAIGLIVSRVEYRYPTLRIPTLGGSIVLLGILTLVTSLRVPVWSHPLLLYQDTVRKSPENTRSRSNLALALFRKGEYGNAFKNLQQLPVDHPVRMDYLGDAEYLSRNASEIEIALNAVDDDPDDLDARVRLGTLARYAHLPETAAEQFDAAIRLSPDDWRAHAGLAILHQRLGHSDRAAELLDTARLHASRAADTETSAALQLAIGEFEQGTWKRQRDVDPLQDATTP